MRQAVTMGLIILFTLSTTQAQTNRKKAQTKTSRKTTMIKAPETNSPAKTAAAFKSKDPVYFPDYYAFYDPNRGYVFWNADTRSWNSSLQPPKFMSSVDMSKTRIQILKGLSLDLYPEQNYPNYMKLYPAKETDPKVPVPDIKQSSAR